MRFTYGCQTDTGTTRANNQDSLVVKTMNRYDHWLVLAAVCDGVGGLNNGEEASRKAADMLSEWFDYELPQIMERTDLWEILRYRFRQVISDINKEIYYSNCRRQISSATTLSALLLWDCHYIIGHAGDSRIYKIGQTVTQLTQDHSWVAQEVALNRMTPQQAQSDSRRNVILKCMGAEPEVDAEFVENTIREATMFILCTDGFWHYVMPEEWKQYFSPDPTLSGKRLWENLYYMSEQIKRRGESDNITAVAINVF